MKHIVIDTGYLLHLFEVDGKSDDESREEILRKFVSETLVGSIFYVPVPVIFELCNIVAQVANGHSRRAISAKIMEAIKQSIESSVPWTITPFEGDDSMLDWLEVLSDALTVFNHEYVHQQIGLTDIAVLRQANKLKDTTSGRPAPVPPVHIWTVDGDLKAREPDTELTPFPA